MAQPDEFFIPECCRRAVDHRGESVGDELVCDAVVTASSGSVAEAVADRREAT